MQRLIERRLDAVVPHEETRRLKHRFVLGQLALLARPAVEISLEEALARLADLWRDDALSARFTPEPAEKLLEEARVTGLVDIDRDRLVFVHPLIATTLSAEAAVACSSLPADLDDELAAFVAALLPETRREDILALLAGGDIFTLARALRLRPSAERQEALAADAERYAGALNALAPLGAGEMEGGLSFLAAADGAWLAMRPRPEPGVELADDSFDVWSAPADGEQALVVFPGAPFAHEIPEFLAAGETLYRFKHRADRVLAKAEPRWPRDDDLVPRLLADEKLLAETALDFFARWRDAITQRAAELGLAETTALPLPDGAPQLTVYRRGEGDALVHVGWGKGSSFSVTEGGEPPYPAYDLRLLAADTDSEARDWLRTRVEEALGSPLDSASWLRPELLAAWVW